ncbi:hypothetical protein V865_005291 [Kwoniella europaea PYCC6329]|uniref:amidase n=1 Tax=Kwoniella europaea PYCC6329 TaxID=1423913 RepID=A0AAX4KME2_9TREE
MSPTRVLDYPALAAKAIAARDETIPSDYLLSKSAYPLPKDRTSLITSIGFLSPEELEIINLSATKLRDAVVSRKYTSVQATTAYCKAAAIAQQATNCLTEMFMDEALERAKSLDEQLENTGKPVGPLHGLPISIKDHMDIKGHDSPSGFLDMVGNTIAEEDAHLVSVLRDAGAVFYVKTTQPQTIMHLETSCYLGTTTNPYNPELTSGGSSGGEGALIGMKGSCLGVGTDIGGSIRAPAAACGIYGFKPSIYRVPAGGCQMPMCPAGYEGIICTHGPMARSVEDLKLYMEVMVGSKPWLRDPTVQVKPWNYNFVFPQEKIRVGIMLDDGVVKPLAPMQRALKEIAAKLEASGLFEVVPYKCILAAEAWDIISKLYWPDGGAMVREHLDKVGEPMLPLSQWIIDWSKELTLEEYLALAARRDEFRRAQAEHWQASGVDVVLSPPSPTPAPALGTAKYWNYTSFWNLTNYPSAIFPTGQFVDATKDAKDTSYRPSNESERVIWDSYDAEQSSGAPISLQVSGYIGHDEATLVALENIVKVIA